MKKKKSIKNKLIQLFLIMGITPSLLIMSILYFGMSSHLEKQSGENQKILAVETSLRVSMFLKNKIENVLKYSSYSTIKRIYFPGSRDDITSQFVRSLFRFDNDLYNISLLDNRKKLVFSYRPNLFSMEMAQNLWDETLSLEKGQILIIPRISNEPSEQFVEIVTPLVSDLNQKRLGVMITTFNLSSLVSLIEDIPISGEYYIALIDGTGNIISHTKYFDTKMKVSKNILNLFEGKQKGWMIGYDEFLNEQSVFGYSEVLEFSQLSIKNNKWYIYVSRKKEEAFRPVVWLMIKLMALCIGVIFVILIIFVFQIETIWKPILSLKKGAEMIGEGNFDMVLFVPTGDELEDLAESFNKMGQNLKASREELERQNQKLTELNSVKNNFLSMVSHELRTPLMIIKEALSQILDGIKGPVPESQKEFLSMALRNAGRLNQIIQDLLSISKIETGKIKFNRKIVDLAELIDSEMTNQRIRSNEKNIKLIRRYEECAVNVYCDIEKVQIIFSNLLSNSIKFTKSGGEISVELEDLPDNVKVTVNDEGPGIPRDSLEKIFERFVRLNATPLVGEPSTGLGLAIAKELTFMHNGSIWAESDGEKGSSFSFTLPKYKRKEYLDIYFQDRINEAIDRRLDLSVFNIMLKISEPKTLKDEEIQNKVFFDLKSLPYTEVVELTDVIELDDSLEFFIFSFSDAKSSSVITEKLREMISEKFHDKYEIENYKAVVLSATLNMEGSSKEEIMNFFQAQKGNI